MVSIRAMGMVGLCISACASVAPVEVRELPSVHRPTWIQTIDSDVEAIRGCLNARKEPSFAVYVYKQLSTPDVGVTTTNRNGEVVLCAWSVREGRVVAQEPLTLTSEEISKQPMLTLEDRAPDVPEGSHVEAVVVGGESVGWLFWLPQ